MLNYIWLGMVTVSVAVALATGTLEPVTKAVLARSQAAVMDVMLPMAGMVTLWMGIMRLVETSGLIGIIARVLGPLLRLVFREVPKGHPALGSIAMNMGANMLGAGNAATPMGLRAMEQLNQLNPHPGVASNAMVMLLALNTSGITLIPASTIALLQARGADHPTDIIAPAILASCLATVCAVAICFLLQRLQVFRVVPFAVEPVAETAPVVEKPVATVPPMAWWKMLVIWSAASGFFAVMIWYTVSPQSLMELQYNTYVKVKGTAPSDLDWFIAVPEAGYQRLMKFVSVAAIPGAMGFFVLYAALAGVKVFEELVEGAREGVATTLRVIPYVVAMLVAVGMFTESGALGLLGHLLQPVLSWLYFPVEVLPIAIVRSLSGGASTAMLAGIADQHGVNSLFTQIAATINGSSETTFYVAAVYFGAVGVRRMRHAIPTGLLADACAVILSVIFCRLLLG
jgi:spore maturation protein SpmA